MSVKQNNRTTVLFKGMSVQTIVMLISVALEMIYFSCMSRLLTKSDFGYFAAITGILAVINSLSEAGLGSAIVQKKNASKEHISTAFTLSVILGAFFSLLVFGSAHYLAVLVADETLAFPLRVMSVTIFLHSINSVGNALLYRKLSFKTIGANHILSYIISASIGIYMAKKGFGLMAIVAFTLINATLYSAFLYLFCVKLPKLKIYNSEVKGIVSFGGWLTLGVVVNNLTHQLDKLLLPKLLSVSALGSYNRPAGFMNTAAGKVNNIFDTVLFPMLSDLQDDANKVRQIFKKAISLLNSFSVVLASVFFFHAELVISVFFGSQWMDLVPVMRILSLWIIFNIDNRLADCFFRSLNLVKYGFYIRLGALFLTIVALVIGSKLGGIIGVAIGVVTANILTVFVKVIVIDKRIGTDLLEILSCWFRSLRPLIMLGITGCVYLFFIPHNLINSVLFALVYAFLILLQFIIKPELVSMEYAITINPYKNRILSRLIKNYGKKETDI